MSAGLLLRNGIPRSTVVSPTKKFDMIEPRYATLQTLFADRVFRIPRYQRFYSWQSKQREDLFSDLRKLADRGPENHHFMATIVCHKTGEVTPIGAKEYRLFDIVDGQQRLTTLIIILKCIELNLEEGSEERMELGKTIVKSDGNLVLLQTNNANEHIFHSFLKDGQLPNPDSVRTHADRNLNKAFRECAQFVGEWGEVMSLLRLVQNRLGFVIFDTEDSRVVYSIFEVLNSRGLVVDWLDKCKSVLMGKAFELADSEEAAEASIDSLQALWGNIYREIADVAVPGQEIVRVTATLHFGPSKGKPLNAEDSLESLRDACTTSEIPRRITEKIYDVTKKLAALEKNIFLGPMTRILQARILAVALESARCLSGHQLKQALSQWERVTFRIFGLFGKDARTKVGDYVRLAADIANEEDGAASFKDIMESLRFLGQDYPVGSAVKEGLGNAYCYESPALCRYVLWRYEEFLARNEGSGATVDEHVRRDIWKKRASDSIEHIFPQTPRPGGPWEGMMHHQNEKPVEHWRHVDRIGNLILLPQSVNSAASRKSFEEKRGIFERHNLRMVRQVLEEKQWTLSEIEKREARIVKWAIKEWADLPVN